MQNRFCESVVLVLVLSSALRGECPPSCESCVSEYVCTKCKDGFYGESCSKNCSSDCTNKACTQSNGNCIACKDGLYLNTTGGCTHCPPSCSNCVSETRCTLCKTGFKGVTCQDNCTNCMPNTGCAKDTGICYKGCEEGFSNLYCSAKCNSKCKSCMRTEAEVCESCAEGRYGKDCLDLCSKNCKEHSCNKTTGHCTHGCRDGYWGENCEKNCSKNCFNDKCLRNNGACAEGCKQNFTGSSCLCPDSCECDKHGNCEQCRDDSEFVCDTSCSIGCDMKICSRNTLACLHGCRKDYSGFVCNAIISDAQMPMENSSGQATIIVLTAVISLLAVVLSIFCWSYRRLKQRNTIAKQSYTREVSAVDSSLLLEGPISRTSEGNFYSQETPLTVPDISADEHYDLIRDSQLIRDPWLVKDQPSSFREKNKNTVEENEDTSIDVAVEQLARCIGNINLNKSTVQETDTNDACKIPLAELEDSIKKLSLSDISIQFQNLPDHKENNTFDQLACKYRPSVMLRVGPTDYFHACFIDGFKQNKGYIACSGPREEFGESVALFWSMVWEENCSEIVMLTDLIEQEEEKCSKYWPDKGDENTYGDVHVQWQTERFYKRFTVRTFIIKKGMEKNSGRHVSQFQFSAWTHLGVPKEDVKFVEFYDRQRRLSAQNERPLVVHCGDGFGRAGMYIAFDLIIQEGNATKCVNIYKCVKKLRNQRTYRGNTEEEDKKFVQCIEQYAFLYQAVLCWYREHEKKEKDRTPVYEVGSAQQTDYFKDPLGNKMEPDLFI